MTAPIGERGMLEELTRARNSDAEADALLRSWFRFWFNSDTVPAKLPESLHIRTAMYLTTINLRRPS